MTRRKLSMKSFISGISFLSFSSLLRGFKRFLLLFTLFHPFLPLLVVQASAYNLLQMRRRGFVTWWQSHDKENIRIWGWNGMSGCVALSGTRRHGKIGSGFPADKRRGCLFPWRRRLLFSFLRGVKEQRERETTRMRKGISLLSGGEIVKCEKCVGVI